MDGEEADGNEAPNGNSPARMEVAANAILTDNDNEATNCSETMSTANEADEDEVGPTRPISCGGQVAVAAAETARNLCQPATRISVKNRPATPRRQPPGPDTVAGGGREGAKNNCDANTLLLIQQRNRGLDHSAPATGVASASGAAPLDDSATDTPSLASLSGIHAPPSYGTATACGQPVGYGCVTLDAAQLAATMSGIGPPGERIYYTLATGARQMAPAQQQRPLLAPIDGKTIAAATMRSTEASGQNQMSLAGQLQEQSRRFSLANNNGDARMQSDTVSVLPASGSHLSSLSYSRSLPRFQLAHLNAVPSQPPSCNASEDLFRQVEERQYLGQFNLRLTAPPDNNQNAKLNVRQAQQAGIHLRLPAIQMLANNGASGAGPINHVISARGSMQQQSANQYGCAASGRLGAPGAAEVASAAAVGQQSLIAGQTCEEAATCNGLAASVRLMDAAAVQRPRTPCWAFRGVQTAPTNRNEMPRSISHYEQESAGTQLGTEFLGEHATHLKPESAESLEGATKPQSQVHKRRRRHTKSNSGRSVSPQSGYQRATGQSLVQQRDGAASFRRPTATLAGQKVSHRRSLTSLLSPTPINASQSLQRSTERIASVRSRPAISAHCWLLDSSDDQTYTTSKLARRLPRKQRPAQAEQEATSRWTNTQKPLDPGEQQQQHLTVAMMRQAQRKQLAQVEPAETEWPQMASNSDQMHLETAINLNYNHQAMPANLKTNSLKLERILSRETQPIALLDQNRRYTSFTLDRDNDSSLKTVQKEPKQRLPRSRSSLDTSSQCEVRNKNAPVPASTIMHLSGLLAFASNLLRLTPKCLKPHQASVHSARPNSISGSISTASGQLAAYTNASLAISSSSSSSAYATGSSSAVPNHANGDLVSRSTPANNGQPPIIPLNLNQRTLKPSSAASTTGSSLFYSSSGTSGFQMATNSSSHGYEYCDTLPMDKYAINETHFNEGRRNLVNGNQNRLFGHSLDGTSTTASSSSSSISSRTRDAQAGRLADQEARRLAHLLMSDNELLSAGSDSANNIDPNTASFGLAGLPAVVSSSAPSAARRRWWWISAKEWMRRPCSNNSEGGSGELAIPGNQSGDSARYKSLRSARSGTGRQGHSRGSSKRRSSPSTLQNVISLAKADWVFRWRLIASIILSIILIILIVLYSLHYARSTALFQRNKISLLIDDADYDISWLWPSQTPQNSHLLLISGTPKPSNSPASNGHAYKVTDYLQSRAGSDQYLDGSLRSQLMSIERSERLEQSQQTMSHLTNIQLANDYFIDITQLPERWSASGLGVHHAPNSTTPFARGPSTLTGNSYNSTQQQQQQQQEQLFSRTHLDLASLTLLSNLHWPLVKWRHQNQQSVANFLSFAMPSPSVSFGGTQTIRSLLSLLMLGESASTKPSHAYMHNLQQFVRLDSLLQTTSKQLISCSLPVRMTSLRAKFCSRLINRYKRMMMTLSNLNHNHLSKLYSAFTQFQQSEHSDDDRQFKLPSSSRTIFGFFADRLALLDVQLLAESVWASNYEETDLIAELEPETDHSQLIEQLVLQNYDGLFQTQETESPDNNWQGNLFEFAKFVIGEGPVKLNLDMERDRQFQAHFQQLEYENHDSWREQLYQDLLCPWPSFKLPQFVEPLNYDLFLHPNLTTRLIMGMAKIEFQLSRPTRYIVLNLDHLNLVDLSLWLKLPTDLLNTRRDQNESFQDGSNDIPNRSQGSTLKSVAIRRVLLNAKLEQIYIELEDNIGSVQENRAAGEENEFQSDGLTFGELPKVRSLNQRDSHFVLSISFNKTSLMSSGWATDSNNREPGLEFARYGDYFAQPEGEIKTILYTEFEPFNARRLFPSFDEPHLKARFQLNLVHEHNHQVLFNAAKRERVPYTADGSLQMSVFESTPIPLSTYLVSFIVCDSQNIRSLTSRVVQLQAGSTRIRSPMSNFDARFATDPQATASKEAKHIQVQVLAQFEHLGQAEFASQLVPQLLAFYQSHLQLGYPLEKLDLVAIPKQLALNQNVRKELFVDTKSGIANWQLQQLDTMENFGLIWFRAPLLLVDTNLINQNLIEQISMIISHQLAHQYFGNIVSIRRRQDLWLFESLSQYLESVALSNVQADWKLEEQYVVSTIQETLALEQFNSGEQYDEEELSLLEPSAAEDIAPTDLVSDPQDDLVHLEMSQDKFIGSEQSGSASKLQRAAGKWSSRTFNPIQLRKSSSVLHMLLFNLLPSNEARARLLRRCLAIYQTKTMSRHQFWRQFGEQLTQAGSIERLPPNLSKVTQLTEMPEPETGTLNSMAAVNSSDPSDQKYPQQQRTTGYTERVVFVKTSLQPKRDEISDSHRIHVRASAQADAQPMDNLELVANAWIERPGYPLITVSIRRDWIILKQERFSFTWWDRSSAESDAPLSDRAREKRSPEASNNNLQLDDVWPIPLMFVSRFNPKQGRFLWMNKRELEIPFDDLSLSQSSGIIEESHVVHLSSPSLRSKAVSHSNSWFKLNVNQSSLVRVNYDERNWEALTELMAKPHYSNHLLGPLDRANLIDDALTLMRCGKLSVGIAMNLTLYLEVGERDFMPWTSTLKHLDQMQTLLNQNPLWHRYVLKLMQPISSVIGWKDDGPHLMRKLRRTLFGVSLQYGDEKVINKAKQEFKAWFKGNRFIVPNLRDLVYMAGVRYGDQQEWFHCWQKYQQLVALDQQENESSSSEKTTGSQILSPAPVGRDKLARSNPLAGVVPLALGAGELNDNEANVENEKRQLLTALASTHNTWLLEQFLNYSLDSTKIQPYHLKHVMQTLGKNPVARLYLWRFVRLNWETLAENHSASYSSDDSSLTERVPVNLRNNRILETMIIESTKHFATKLDYEEVKAFAAGKKIQRHYWSPSVEHVVQQSLQLIKSNIYWRDYIEPKLTNWLSHYDNLLSK